MIIPPIGISAPLPFNMFSFISNGKELN